MFAPRRSQVAVINSCLSSVRRFRSRAQPEGKYDVVIVGGGHNGLVAAAYLAKAGARVCLLERRYLLGGAAVTEEIIPGFKFSRASYLLSLMRPQIYTDLKLKEHGLKVYLRDPHSYTPVREHFWRSPHARSLTLSRDMENNKKEIAKFSTKDAEAYEKYEELLTRLVTTLEPLMDISPHSFMDTISQPSLWGKAVSAWGKGGNSLTDLVLQALRLGPDLRPLYELITASPYSVLSRWFESEPLRATLATDSLIGTMASTRHPGVGYVLLHHVMGGVEGVRGAWAYPAGGMGAVSDALASAARSFGAELYTDQLVTSIKTNGANAAAGVTTSTGLEVDARLVLSNATPAVTLDLLPEDILSGFITHAIRAINYDSPVTKINVALSRLPSFLADPSPSGQPAPLHQATIHLNCENCGLLDDAYRQARTGNLPSRPMIEMVIPSSLDPSLAPPGGHVCLLFTQFTPYHLSGGRQWDTMVKEEYAQMVFDCVEEYAPGFKSSVIGKEVLPPPDLEQIFGLTGGNIFHGTMTVNQLFLNRPVPWGAASPYTPVEGLLLCGAGAHPGGGVTGAPGRLAALEAAKLLKL